MRFPSDHSLNDPPIPSSSLRSKPRWSQQPNSPGIIRDPQPEAANHSAFCLRSRHFNFRGDSVTVSQSSGNLRQYPTYALYGEWEKLSAPAFSFTVEVAKLAKDKGRSQVHGQSLCDQMSWSSWDSCPSIFEVVPLGFLEVTFRLEASLSGDCSQTHREVPRTADTRCDFSFNYGFWVFPRIWRQLRLS